ncbi:MAG: rhodanese-like domain-containing protein [Hyalangium sp.]|uniref:rhodanese-like domain-containing protein n=1 Tax=Hyalangium sp. TaxID=2028555 RepID=UPI00389AA233
MHAASIHSVHPRALGTLPPSVRRIDVREPAEFQGALGRLPRSELIPLATLPGTAAVWPRGEPLLLICRSGARSMKAAQILAELGFTSLYNLEGGMLAALEADVEVEGQAITLRMSPGQARDALCAAVRELYGPRTPPPCESLFEVPSGFPAPDRFALLQALNRLGARARADGLSPEAIEHTVRRMRELVALMEDWRSPAS